MINHQTLIADLEDYANTVTLPSEKATKIFRNAFTDTIKHTITIEEDNQVFVATGDIPAMWLRDSTFQVLPYLTVIDQVDGVRELLCGVLKQQMAYVDHDPYANAFNQAASGAHYSDDDTNIVVSDLVWERKFEIDSLCAPLFLAVKLYNEGKEKSHLTSEFWRITEKIVDVFIKEQHHETSDYYFNRSDCPPSDTLIRRGKGAPVGYTGMVWSGFRPSDDACEYGYFIPGNQYIVVVLTKIQEIMLKEHLYPELQQKMQKLVLDIEQGIETFAVLRPDKDSTEKIYAYEVDGLGNQLFMDDANVPSLLSLPFLGYETENSSIYLATRNFILSEKNPYYYVGSHLQGIGSQHTPPRYVWPIALAMEGLTSEDVNFIEAKIEQISQTDNDTLQCHEGVFVDDPSIYTREWFSWANMTFCQLVFHYLQLAGK